MGVLFMPFLWPPSEQSGDASCSPNGGSRVGHTPRNTSICAWCWI